MMMMMGYGHPWVWSVHEGLLWEVLKRGLSAYSGKKLSAEVKLWEKASVSKMMKEEEVHSTIRVSGGSTIKTTGLIEYGWSVSVQLSITQDAASGKATVYCCQKNYYNNALYRY